MINNIRVVVDTNVLVSGLFGIEDSPSAQILNAFHDQKIILVTSPAILKEVVDVINRDRIIKRTKMGQKERAGFIDKLIERCDVTPGKKFQEVVSRDITDDKFLSCAIEAQTDYIITGDEDLLELKEYEGIKIVTPREFIEFESESNF